MYLPPRADVSFGDIFEAPFLFDAHLRGDARLLSAGEFPQKAPLSGVFFADPSQQLPLGQQDNLLAHGRTGRHDAEAPGRAVLLTDDCAIETVLGKRADRGGARGRLLFGIVRNEEAEAVAALAESDEVNFGRFPLPADSLLGDEAGVLELRRLFMVDARDVEAEMRLASLDDETRDRLAKRFSAYVLRRGSEVGALEATKLTAILAAAPGASDIERETAELVGAAYDAAWDFESRATAIVDDLDIGIGTAADALPVVVAALDELATVAVAAARALEERLAAMV